MLEGSYGKRSEPALEPCMKIQRSIGVNGKRSRTQHSVLIRVVPPMIRSLEVRTDFKGLFIILRLSAHVSQEKGRERKWQKRN